MISQLLTTMMIKPKRMTKKKKKRSQRMKKHSNSNKRILSKGKSQQLRKDHLIELVVEPLMEVCLMMKKTIYKCNKKCREERKEGQNLMRMSWLRYAIWVTDAGLTITSLLRFRQDNTDLQR